MFTFRKVSVPYIYLDDYNLFLMNDKKKIIKNSKIEND